MNAQTQTPPVKLYRNENRVTVAAPMPGLEPQDISIQVNDDGTLVLYGKLRGMLKGEKEVLMDEWNPGPYRRSVQLPQGVDGASAIATYNNGVLVISMLTAHRTIPGSIDLQRLSATEGMQAGKAGRP